MRIISGKWRGRRFYLPKGASARPTSDMLREALFSILRNEVNGAIILDLFAGSASFAFEALSRGAEHVIICDNDRKCINAIIQNLERFNAAVDEYTILNTDFKLSIKKIAKSSMCIDVCYIDPPYKSDYYIEALELAGDIMNPDGIVITEHARRDSMPESIGTLIKEKVKKYGNTAISIYRKVN